MDRIFLPGKVKTQNKACLASDGRGSLLLPLPGAAAAAAPVGCLVAPVWAGLGRFAKSDDDYVAGYVAFFEGRPSVCEYVRGGG